MNSIVPFQFESTSIRTMTDERNGSTWFVLRDVLEAMGSGSRTNDAKASIIEALGDGVVTVVPIVDSLGRPQDATVVSESGVTYLIAQSRTETGKKLNKWLHLEVIPAIRNTGSYTSPTAPSKRKENRLPYLSREFKGALSLCKLIGLEGNAATLAANQAMVRVHGENVLEMIDQIHLISDSQQVWFTPTQLGRDMNLSASDFNKLLEKEGYQVKIEGGGWKATEKGKPFSKLFDTTKRHGKGTPITQLKWATTIMTEVVNRAAA